MLFLVRLILFHYFCLSYLFCLVSDPMVMSQRYFERVREREDVPVATSSSSAPSRNETMPQMQVPRRPARETNEKGDPFAPLVLLDFALLIHFESNY